MVTVPTAPGPWKITSYGNTWAEGAGRQNSTGGATILEWQLAWGISPNRPTDFGNVDMSTGEAYVLGLQPGANTYFWNRVRNSVGWSAWSGRTMIRMRDVPDPPKAPSFWSGYDQTSVTVQFLPNWTGDSPITTYTLGYGLSPNTAQFSVTKTQPIFPLNNLQPGGTYYFWGRATNVYGDSDMGARSSLNLVAGAYVKVGFVYKRALPYIRVGGIYKLARPWGKSAGVWKELND